MRRLVAWLALAAASAWAAPDDSLLAAANAAQPAVLRTLQQLVEIETGAGDPEGLQAMATLLAERLAATGAEVTRHPGGHVQATLRGSGRGRVMLLAHADTVYPRGTLAKAPFRVDGVRAFGPGIADAKGGVALVLHALALLAERRAGFAQVSVLINADEERGSTTSRDIIRRLAGEHDAVLSFEPTLSLRESFTRATSGVGGVQVQVAGRAAHAGAPASAGANALLELVDYMHRSADLDQPERGLRLTWTQAQAGAGANNVVPDTAWASADLRYAHEDDLAALEAALTQRAQRTRVPGTTVQVKLHRGRPAWVASAASLALMERAIALYREVGGDVAVVDRVGGGTDAAYAAQAGVPVLEGLGLPGFGYHSTQAEYVMADAIPRRLYLAVKLALEVAAGR